MSNERLIKKYFNFLKLNGYKRKSYFRNGDCEITYSKNDLTIEVSCELGIQSNEIPFSTQLNIEELLEKSSYVVTVIIKKDLKRNNILCCNLFDEDSREKLKLDISKTEDKNLEQIIKIYSQFLMDGINRLEA